MRSLSWMSTVIVTAVAAPALAGPAPRIAFEVPADYHLIDGIATDGSTFWLSSVKDRVIVERRSGKFRAIPLPADVGRPRGLDYDPRRNMIWIATDCPVGGEGGSCTTGMLLAIDRNGAIKRRLAPPSGKAADFDQVNISGYNDVYKAGDRLTEQVTVADARTGAIYVCRDECNSLDDVASLLAAGKFRNLKDSGVKLDGNWTPPAKTDVNDVAGMAFAGSYTLISQRVAGGRVIAFQRFNGAIHNPKIVAQGSDVPEPGQIATWGTKAWVVADSQWSSYAAGTPAPQRPTPIVFISVPQ